jgi:fluoroacetyl-CoA thioesterase
MEIGTLGQAELVVDKADLACALALLEADAFPSVFATSRMIALMELAAARAMQPLLQPSELSVGVRVEVSHLAPTPVGARVVAEARFTGMDGKLYVFDVSARDTGGEIGCGTHRRAIVSAERLLAGAERRCGQLADSPAA